MQENSLLIEAVKGIAKLEGKVDGINSRLDVSNGRLKKAEENILHLDIESTKRTEQVKNIEADLSEMKERGKKNVERIASIDERINKVMTAAAVIWTIVQIAVQFLLRKIS